jgi:hypothetical protein
MILKEKILFSKEECESIILYNDTHITNWIMGDRKFNSQPIRYSLETKWLFDKLKTFFEEESNIQIKRNKEVIHFHKFTKGDWFGKHNDIRENRLYAVGVLLSDDFEGGDFKLYNPNEIVLNKVMGNTYLFDTRIDHEITPILKGERYSLLWFLQNEHINPLEINKLI